MQQLLGVLIVVIHHILAVPLGGGRARAFVENRFDIAELFASHNLDQEVFLIHIVCDIQIHQVHKLGAVFQVVHHQNIGDAFIIQGLNDVAADKARAAGNDDHNCNLRIMESETISDTNASIISLHGVGFSHSPKVRLMDVIYPEFCRSVNASSRRDL